MAEEGKPERPTCSEPLLSAVFESASDAMLLIDEDGIVIDANLAACALFALTLEALLGQNASALVHAAAMPDDGGDVWSAFRAEGHLRCPMVVTRVGGAPREVEVRATANVVPGLCLLVLCDANANLRSERRWQALLEGSTDVIAVTGPDNVTTDVSPEIERIIGFKPAAFIGAASTAPTPMTSTFCAEWASACLRPRAPSMLSKCAPCTPTAPRVGLKSLGGTC